MTLRLLVSALILAASTAARAQNDSTIRLWDGPAPGAQGNEGRDIPTLTAYVPSGPSATKTAIVVCPGGSYHGVSIDYEGREAQEYLNSLGVAVFVLKYRVGPRYHHPIELGDALRAMRLVRSHATEWHLAPDRVGIMGFSAGGHLASTVSTHFDAGSATAADPIDRVSSRPDFAILVYPVISMTAPWTHQGSKDNLLGANPDSSLARSLSNDLMVTPQTPPTFIVHAGADDEVPPENSVTYYLALRKAGVPAELHVFQNGGHGFAMAQGDATLGEWPRLLTNWLQANGLLK